MIIYCKITCLWLVFSITELRTPAKARRLDEKGAIKKESGEDGTRYAAAIQGIICPRWNVSQIPLKCRRETPYAPGMCVFTHLTSPWWGHFGRMLMSRDQSRSADWNPSEVRCFFQMQTFSFHIRPIINTFFFFIYFFFNINYSTFFLDHDLAF